MSGNEFHPGSLGFYSQEDLAYLLDVSPRSVRDWLSKGEAPEKYATAIFKAGGETYFPIDAPPGTDVISAVAWNALDLLRRGKPEVAAYISYPERGRNWKTGEEKALRPLERAYLDLAVGIAWVRSPAATSIGFELMTRLRRIAGRAYRTTEPDELQYWRYVYILAANYSLLRVWAKREIQFRASKKNQKRLCTFCKGLLELALGKPPRYIKVLSAWNSAQFAAIANDTGLFIDALDAIEKNHCNPIKYVIAKLKRDKDTAPMLNDARVATFISRINHK
jgi:hypothetical protein